ncbi:MAG: gas vesicle protein [Pseudonocardiaceae bacterium]|nr:gas vesicle protein [Pseudonocardiaceae bacterium]
MTELTAGQGTSIVDLLDRVVDRGAVLSGDAIISLAGVDLIRLDLRLLLIGVDEALHPASRGVADERAP